jgi:hypothetical protein
VQDSVIVNVKKPGNATLFKAEVLCRSDTADLALLRVPDDSFWEGVEVRGCLGRRRGRWATLTLRWYVCLRCGDHVWWVCASAGHSRGAPGREAGGRGHSSGLSEVCVYP